jgi:hypothetical protein
MVQQCSENQYLWEHFTVYVCVEGVYCVLQDKYVAFNALQFI